MTFGLSKHNACCLRTSNHILNIVHARYRYQQGSAEVVAALGALEKIRSTISAAHSKCLVHTALIASYSEAAAALSQASAWLSKPLSVASDIGNGFPPHV